MIEKSEHPAVPLHLPEGIVVAASRAMDRSRARRCRIDPFEWFSASVMTAIGAHLLVWPDAIHTSRLAAASWMMTGRALTVACLVVGAVRLYANATADRWMPWCAHTRAICGGVAAFVWAQLAYALYVSWSAAPSITMWVYAGMAATEVVMLVWAARLANARR